MDDQKLQQAKDLSDKIKLLKKELENWSKATGFYSVYLTSAPDPKGYKSDNRYSSLANEDHIDFEMLKTFTVATIQKKLAAAETEYANL